MSMIVYTYFMLIAISLAGFFSGSMLYAYKLPKRICHVDIREISEDGNPGTANVFQYCGKKCGILTGICEFGKGFFPVFAGNLLVNKNIAGIGFGLIIAAPVLGHMFSVFHGGRGGMGIAPLCGTLIAVFLKTKLLVFLVSIYAFYKFVLKFHRQQMRTICVFGTFSAAALLFEQNSVFKYTYMLLAFLVIIKAVVSMHRNCDIKVLTS